MTVQLTSSAMQQVKIIGTFFDAKHQLETQRIFQKLTAKAHKDYHPSKGICVTGTATRSLGASGRHTDLAAANFAKRITDRQLLTKGLASQSGKASDDNSRLVDFIKKYCNEKDNGHNLDFLCLKSEKNTALFNKDIDYTNTVDSPLTLDIDFTDDGTPLTEDESALFALTSNLISNNVFPNMTQAKIMTPVGKEKSEAISKVYLDARSTIAKRSVAANSIASIAALKAQGNEEAQPFLYAIMEEMSGDGMDADTIEKTLGKKPSYHAQMEVLTKTLYQSPVFYADLYDKPANVLRKNVALQAATLMQKRDLYRSYLRSEMSLAVMLETLLTKEQTTIKNEVKRLSGKDIDG